MELGLYACNDRRNRQPEISILAIFRPNFARQGELNAQPEIVGIAEPSRQSIGFTIAIPLA